LRATPSGLMRTRDSSLVMVTGMSFQTKGKRTASL
jgi:hypothetical protein